jgi:alkanesulfonate monooxygenase SsuD/methylene tetrahydromethanopterin reductase-like flavin-dependent oxidoreductase (luciferase family)
MDIAIMIEGQDGLTWPRWQSIAQVVEELGFSGLFRSDHFTNVGPPDKDSLELWVSLTWLASHTRRMASAVDDLSGGRLVLGLGAGWQVREHELFGFELLEPKERFDRFEEGLEVITRLLNNEEPVTFEGHYFQLRGATLLPRPFRPGGPRVAIGGNGLKRTLPYVARYASEWNAVYLPADKIKSLNVKLDVLLKEAGRPPESVRRSAMLGCHYGTTSAQVREKLSNRDQTFEALRQRGAMVGTGEQIREQLIEVEAAGVQRVMLQWLELDDLEGLKSLAKEII